MCGVFISQPDAMAQGRMAMRSLHSFLIPIVHIFMAKIPCPHIIQCIMNHIILKCHPERLCNLYCFITTVGINHSDIIKTHQRIQTPCNIFSSFLVTRMTEAGTSYVLLPEYEYSNSTTHPAHPDKYERFSALYPRKNVA